MKIWTTYWANLKNLPPEITPISICGKPIPGWTGLEYKKLAPSWSIWKEYRETRDEETYVRRFLSEILAPLSPGEVLTELTRLAGPGDIALVCYEKPEDFCHRHIVAWWLGNGIEEYGKEKT